MTTTKKRKAGGVLKTARGQETKEVHRVPPKWAKHYRRLLALRTNIEAARKGSALAANEPRESFSMDMADAATDEFDRDLALGTVSARQDTLYEIDEALKRIESGTYGVCELTGKPIPRARLNALPWTRFAQEAEQRLEQTGMVRSKRLGELRSVMPRQGEGKLKESEVRLEMAHSLPSDETLSRINSISKLKAPLPAPRKARPVRKRPVVGTRRRQRGVSRKH